MSRGHHWLDFLPVTLSLILGVAVAGGPAAAQDSGTSVVPKTTAPRSTAAGILPATPPGGSGAAAGLRPAQDVQTQPEQPPAGAPSTAAAPPNQIPPAPPVDAAAPAGDVNNDGADQGAGWQAAVQAAPGPTPLIGEERDQAIARINAYFNAVTSLQGNFTQVDSDNKTTTGRFYVQRPGKLRFDYAPPSPLRIVSDGSFLAIEDSDLKTIEKYPIGSTPFRLLLAGNVDLARDAKVLGVDKDDTQLSITLEDKDESTSGTIKLVFSTDPDLKLIQWVITDPEGLTTTVSLDDLGPGRKVAADFFQSRASFNPFH